MAGDDFGALPRSGKQMGIEMLKWENARDMRLAALMSVMEEPLVGHKLEPFVGHCSPIWLRVRDLKFAAINLAGFIINDTDCSIA